MLSFPAELIDFADVIQRNEGFVRLSSGFSEDQVKTVTFHAQKDDRKDDDQGCQFSGIDDHLDDRIKQKYQVHIRFHLNLSTERQSDMHRKTYLKEWLATVWQNTL
jgi:hypothetical protein